MRSKEVSELVFKGRQTALDRLQLAAHREQQAAPVLTQRLLVRALLRTDCPRPPGRRVRELQRVRIGQRQRKLDVTAVHRKLNRGARARLDEGEVRCAVTVEHALELEARTMYAHAGAGSVRSSLEGFCMSGVSQQL